MTKNGAAPTSVAPPAGSGFTAGMGENFSLDLNSGQGTFSIPFDLPDGVAGHKPQIKLEYVHGQSNGAFGLGWRLQLREINRRLDLRGPDADFAEVFLDGATELRPREDGSYAAVREMAFSRYARNGGGWSVREKDGRRDVLGESDEARIGDPARPDRAIGWLLQRSEDAHGNVISYRYAKQDGWPCLEAITYAAVTVRFLYEDRPDIVRSGRGGFLRRLTRRCHAITAELTATGEVFRRLSLRYEQAAGTGVSILAGAQLSAHRAGQPDVVKNPVSLDYSAFDPSAISVRLIECEGGALPPSLDDPDTALVVLDDLPLPGVVSNRNGRLTYWPNSGRGSWAAPRPLPTAPFVRSFAAEGVQLLDMDGTGRADMLVGIGGTALRGYYENKGSEGFGQFVPRPRRSAAEPPFGSGRMRLADMDGDGVVDAVHSLGRGVVYHDNQGRAGWADPSIAPLPDGVSFADPLVFLADMTGDGQADLVRVRSGEVTYWPALGQGRFGAAERMARSPRLEGIHRSPQDLFLIDVDGDGCADLVRIGATGIELHLNQAGSGFAAPVRHAVVPQPIPGSVRPADFDGTGRFGLIYATRRASGIAHVHFRFGAALKPYLLQTIDNGMGAQTTIRYLPMTYYALRDRDAGRPWATTMPFPLWLVSETLEHDRVRDRTSRVQYRYHDGHFDPLFRRFQGFGEVDKIERGDDSRPDTLSRHRFLMNQAGEPGAPRNHAHLDRLLERVDVMQLDGGPDQGRPLKSEVSSYDVSTLETLPDGIERVFVAVRATQKIYSDRTQDRRIEERRFAYDAFGNITSELAIGRGRRNGAAVPQRSLLTEVSYASDPGQTIFKVASTVKRDSASAIVQEERKHYDGLPLGQLSRGLCTREEHLVLDETAFDNHYAGMDAASLGMSPQADADGAPAVFALDIARTHTAQGNIETETTGTGRRTVKTYDAAGVHLVREEVNGNTTQRNPDPVHGKPLELVSGSGAVARMAYDAFGRMVRYMQADDTPETATRILTYDDGAVPVSMAASYRIDAGARARTVTYYDGSGKEVQKRAERGPGEVVVSGWSVQNPYGDTAQEFEPTLAATLGFARPSLSAPSRRARFDAIGRPVASTNYNGATSRAEYRPFRLTFWDAIDETVGHRDFDTPRIEEVDAWNFRTLVEEQGAAGPVRTRYETDLFGRVLSLSDDAGVIATYHYDRQGNRLAINHRDAGLREQWFDSHDDPVRTRDAKGNDVTVERDDEGRVARVLLNGAEVESFVYGDADPNADGRMVRATYRGGAQSFGYSARGFLSDHQVTVDGQSFAFTAAHNDMGRRTALTYPDGTVSAVVYTPNGLVSRIEGVIDAITYDAKNMPVEVRFSNGVVSSFTYEPGVGHLAAQRSTGPQGAVIEDVAYGYDALMRLISRADTAPGGESTSYEHDPLGQLTSARFDLGGQVETIGYSHDGGYNLTEVGGSGWSLGYDDAARPDRLTRVTLPGEAPSATAHDANGNLEGMAGASYRYNFKNQLERAELPDGTVVTYDYDYRGNRVRRVVDQGGVQRTTIYLGRLVEITEGQVTRFTLLNGRRVAMDRGGARRWIHVDHLGSATRFSDETGTVIAEIAYAPFGTERRRSGAPPLRIFALHDYDEVTGLVYMGHRWFAPATGRFLTPDPLYLHEPERADGEQVCLRLYTYTANDPADYTDPDGLSFWSVLGAIVGVIVGVVVAVAIVAAFALGIGFGILAIAGLVALTTVSYIIAHNNQGTGVGEFFRGFMIGMNAGLNAAFLTMMGAGALGVVIGVIGFLGAIDSIASSEIYQGIIGWSNWLMPMSWLVTGAGAIMWILNGLGHLLFWSLPRLFGGNGLAAFRITGMRMDWQTGMLATRGGWITALMPLPTAFNMGNFSWVHPASAGGWHMDHEAGHNLNLAVYGSIFHLIGAIHEVPMGAGANAFSEIHADSNDGSPGMWS